MRIMRCATVIGFVVAASIGQAATAQAGFTGLHVGAAVTAVDHHFVIEEQDRSSAMVDRFNVTRWGPGGQVFAGYDLSLVPRTVVGVEASFDFGGREAIERNAYYALGIGPRHGYAVTARVGFVATPALMLYAGGGFGGHDYRVTDSVDINSGDDPSKNRSFVLRGGGEYRVIPHVAVRAEFEHLDGTRNTFLLGVPVRF